MPQTGMDVWTIIGVLAAIVALFFAWRQLKGGKAKTTNTVEHGSRNRMKGGDGETVNKVTHGDDNDLSG